MPGQAGVGSGNDGRSATLNVICGSAPGLNFPRSKFPRSKTNGLISRKTALGAKMDEVEREQTKLFANALDRASTACLAVGVLTPISAVFFAAPGYSSTPIWIIEFGVGAWMLCTLALHSMAMRALRGLQE